MLYDTLERHPRPARLAAAAVTGVGISAAAGYAQPCDAPRFPNALYPTGGDSADLALADFDGDGDLDIAAANRTDNTIGVLLNDGNSIFSMPQVLAGGQNPVAIAAANLNADNAPDLI